MGALLSRLSLSVLAQRGILDDSLLAASLHSTAISLNHSLSHRQSVLDLQNKNILKHQMEDHQHVDQIYHKRKESLTEALQNRRDISAIADLGYIDDSGMAPRLQPTALRLNRRLTERKTRDELVIQGIIETINNEEEEEQQIKESEQAKKKKKKKGKRNTRSEKREKTPSIIWKDVKS